LADGRILNIEGSTGAVMRATSSRPSSRVLVTAPSSSATLQMPRPVPDGESRGLGGCVDVQRYYGDMTSFTI